MMIITTSIKLLIGLTGLLIFISINPIYSVLSLISVFIFTGSLFIYFDISFIGLSYFIIYVGAISILFIFAIMMLETDQFINPSLKEKLGLKKEIPLISGIIGLLIISILFLGENQYQNENLLNLVGTPKIDRTYIFDYLNGTDFVPTTNVMQTNYSLWENSLFSISQIKFIGYSLYTYYSLWLILISFILLLAMIGPIILCLKWIEQE